MKLILEQTDIETAVVNYLRDVLHVDVADPALIAFALPEEGGGLTAVVPNARPRAPEPETAAQLAAQTFNAPTPTPVGGPPPLDKTLDELKAKSSVNWNEQAFAATDLRALGKEDLTDFSDELGPRR